MTTITTKSYSVPLTIAGISVAALMAYLLREFLPSMGWALLLAVTTWGLFEKVLDKMGGRRVPAALLTSVVIAIGLGLPVLWLGTLVSAELHRALGFVQKANAEGVPVPAVVDAIPAVGHIIREYWEQSLSGPNQLIPLILEKLSLHASFAPLLVKDAGMRLLHLAIEFFFAILTLFFAYLHGPSLSRQARAIGLRLLGPTALPYFDMLPVTLRATVSGMILVAIGEGVVLGAAYWIAGLPSIATISTATALMAIVPGGAPLSFSLASLYLYGTGQTLAAIALISWGAFQLFIVDHFIRPRLIGDAAKLPFLVVLFGLLGGLTSFGLVGLFIGPTCTATGYLMWKNLSKEH